MRFILESRTAQVVVALYLIVALALRYIARLYHWGPTWVVECAFLLILLAGLFALPILEAVCKKQGGGPSNRDNGAP